MCHHSERLSSELETKLYINGKFVEGTSSKKIVAKCPNTEEEIATFTEPSESEIDSAVCAAKAALGKWYLRTSARERGDYLRKMACELRKNEDIFADIESRTMGKPIEQAKKDINTAVCTLQYYAGWADKIHGDVIPVNHPEKYLCYTRKEPVGVCCMIIPWNYPIMLLVLKMAPALACGCTCVIKPSEKSPATALKFAHILQKIQLPAGVVNILCGHGPSVGEPLAKHKDIDLISFTGSTLTGKKLSIIAAEGVKRINLELGGKSPLIICDDADLDQSVETACRGLFLANTGQCCIASTRLLVQENIYDTFVDKLKDRVMRCTVGNSKEKTTEIGPLADHLQFDRVMKYIQDGKDEGANPIIGGCRKGDKGYFVEPTIFVDVNDDMKICKEEIFGPVVVVQKFSKIEEAVRRANATSYGLGAGVCTQNMAIAHNVINRLKAGSVFINCYNDTDINAPFGGFKQSGIGKEFGEEGLAPFLETKCCYARIDVDESMFQD